jgi:hypothetical protein
MWSACGFLAGHQISELRTNQYSEAVKKLLITEQNSETSLT